MNNEICLYQYILQEDHSDPLKSIVARLYNRHEKLQIDLNEILIVLIYIVLALNISVQHF